jgi:hypothetical protein
LHIQSIMADQTRSSSRPKLTDEERKERNKERWRAHYLKAKQERLEDPEKYAKFREMRRDQERKRMENPETRRARVDRAIVRYHTDDAYREHAKMVRRMRYYVKEQGRPRPSRAKGTREQGQGPDAVQVRLNGST